LKNVIKNIFNIYLYHNPIKVKLKRARMLKKMA
jgi:hypothetical protein